MFVPWFWPMPKAYLISPASCLMCKMLHRVHLSMSYRVLYYILSMYTALSQLLAPLCYILSKKMFCTHCYRFSGMLQSSVSIILLIRSVVINKLGWLLLKISIVWTICCWLPYILEIVLAMLYFSLYWIFKDVLFHDMSFLGDCVCWSIKIYASEPTLFIGLLSLWLAYNIQIIQSAPPHHGMHTLS